MAPEKTSGPRAEKPAPKTVADFTVLALTLPTPHGLPEHCKDAKHYIYIKPHAPTVPTATDDRSLFVANTPIDATESNLRALFVDQLGGSMVERVEFDAPIPAQPMHKRWKTDQPDKGGEARGKKRKRNEEALVAEGVIEDEDSALPSIWPGELRRSGSGAVVIFVDKRSARGAFKELQKAAKESRTVHWKSGDAALGVERTSTHYYYLFTHQQKLTHLPGYRQHNTLTFPTATTLQASLNAYLTQFNALETLRNKHRKTARSVPDEDGFVTVTRGGRAGPARLEDTEKKKAELDARKKKNAVKDDFYRFQNREKRKEIEMGLRRRFEEDRKRVERMRETRGRVRPET
jgi:ribosomal RNA-processing protein 7